MAKQSVSFVERHLEKIVVGVAALITLTVAAMYVVTSPNSVDVGGTTVGPGDISARLKDEAKSNYQRIVAEKAKPDPVPDFVAAVNLWRPSQLDQGLKPTLAVAPTPLNPQPPAVTRIDITGKNRLATILPPGKPVVLQGRNRATLAEATSLSGVLDTPVMRDATPTGLGAPNPATTVTDLTWITVAAPVFRSKQLDEFSAAQYIPTRTAILLTRVRLERQKLLPDGTWSEPPESVETYTKHSPIAIPEINLTDDGAGLGIDAESNRQLDQLLGALKKPETQAVMWRPPLAPYLDTKIWPPTDAPQMDSVTWDDWTWRDTPGSAFKGTPLAAAASPEAASYERKVKKDVTKTEQTPKRTARPPAGEAAGKESTASAKPATPPKKSAEGAEERSKAITSANENLKQADKAYNEGNYPMADQLLSDVLRNEALLPRNILSRAEKLKENVDAKRKDADEKAAKQRLDREARQQGKIEADVEPVWAHDLTAQIGSTYRYRVQIEVLNLYAGCPRDLSNPEDAKKVVLASDWSEWSDPITVRPDTYFFLQSTSNDGAGGAPTATVDLWKWVGGKWKNVGKKKFDVGQRIACDDRKIGHVDTQMTVIEIDANAKRTIRMKTTRKDGSFDIKADQPVQVLLVADAAGQVWERNNVDDRSSPDLSELKSDKTEEALPRAGGREPLPRMAAEPQ